MNKAIAVSFSELSATLFSVCVVATFLVVWFNSY